MTDDEKRTAALVIAITCLGLVPGVALLVQDVVELSWPTSIAIALAYLVGGWMALIVVRLLMPILRGCDCEKCQPDGPMLWFAFVGWPVVVPFFLVASPLAAIVRATI